VPYRRRTPPRGNSGGYEGRRYRQNERSETISTSETILVQSMICGLLLAIVLVICLVDIAPMVSLRGGLNQVLAGATTMEEFTSEVRQFSQNWFNWPEQVEEVTAPTDLSNPPQPLSVGEEPYNTRPIGSLVAPGLWD